MKTIVNVEIRDSQDVLFGYAKRNISLAKALSFLTRHNGTIWKNGLPYILQISVA